MRLFISDTATGNFTAEETVQVFPRRLVSFAYKLDLYKFASLYDRENLIIDSGAFTAKFALQTDKFAHVNAEEYEAFLAEFKPKYYIQLDVIGDGDATFANYVRMRENGFDPLPVIQFGASRAHIENILPLADYICIGGIAKNRKSSLDAFLSYIFGHKLARGKRFHLLGITTESILKRYPAYSCDSSTVSSPARFPITNPKSLSDNMLRSAQKDLWTANEKREYRRRLIRLNMQNFFELEQRITEYWRARGIDWDKT